MAATSNASVLRISAVSTCSFVRSPPRVKSTIVTFGIQKFSYGCSSSKFLSSETPFSVVVLKTGGKPGTKIVHAQAQKVKKEKVKKVKQLYVRPSQWRRMKEKAVQQYPPNPSNHPKPLKAPANGLLVEKLIPLAHSVYEAYLVVLDGVSRLMKHLPVRACRWCSEIHVARLGHAIKTCPGKYDSGRNEEHSWVPGYLDDVVAPLEAFHLFDRLQKVIADEDRYKHDRIPAIVELCIQAGVDLPDFPTVRRTKPVDSSFIWPGVGSGEDFATIYENKTANEATTLASSSERVGQSMATDQPEITPRDETFARTMDVLTISDDDDLKTVANKTLRAWDQMRAGAARLMATYPVKTCECCPEVHIGRSGHKVQLCGACKKRWLKGQHWWEDATLDDLIPRSLVWHVRDQDGPPLRNEFAKYYGKAPAVVELCVQAGADIPSKYEPHMRLDVIIPDEDELNMDEDDLDMDEDELDMDDMDENELDMVA